MSSLRKASNDSRTFSSSLLAEDGTIDSAETSAGTAAAVVEGTADTGEGLGARAGAGEGDKAGESIAVGGGTAVAGVV